MSNTTTITSALLPTSTILPPQNGTASSTTSSSSFGGGIITAFVIAGIVGFMYLWLTFMLVEVIWFQKKSMLARIGLSSIVLAWPLYVLFLLISEWWKKGASGRIKDGVEVMIRRMAGWIFGWLDRLRKEELKRIEDGEGSKEKELIANSKTPNLKMANGDRQVGDGEGATVPTEGGEVAPGPP